jgi:hypothetical protein
VLYICEFSAHTIQYLDIDRGILKPVPLHESTRLFFPQGICLALDNSALYVADTGSDSVMRLSFDGTLLNLTRAISQPSAIITEGKDSILISSMNGIYRIGELSQAVPTCELVLELDRPCAFAWVKPSVLAVVEQNRHRILQLDLRNCTPCGMYIRCH